MKHLTSEQRYAIKLEYQAGKTQKEIADKIGVHKSTISRELRRNCDARNSKYDNDLAQRKADKRKKEKRRKEEFDAPMKEKVKTLLGEGYSPEQITGRVRLEGEKMVSHETIYRWIWENKRKKGDLHTHLRRQGRKYAKRGSANKNRGMIPDRVDIDQRPKIVEQKQRFGDLEIDTMIGKNHKGAILTINDRASGWLWIRMLTGKDALLLAQATNEALRSYINLIYTITADNGKEFAKHKLIAEEMNIDFYFCKPYHSWERGANENTNGLIRQYIPKKTDFSTITNEEIQMIQDKLNNRPRKRLGYLTPREKLTQITNPTSVAFVS